MPAYIEADSTFEDIPGWVRAMLEIGYSWAPNPPNPRRRLAVISMPCTSNAAALVALGVLRRDLGRKNANDTSGHFESLMETCRSFLDNKQDRDAFVIDRHDHKWKFKSLEESGYIKVVDTHHSAILRKRGQAAENPNSATEAFIVPGNALDWHLHNSPISQADGTIEQAIFYEVIYPNGNVILEENLNQSYSRLLLVGESADPESKYMLKLGSSKFRYNENTMPLSRMLTLNNPLANRVARLKFCSHRSLKDFYPKPYMVIADGIPAFLKALDRYPESDVICVYSRDAFTRGGDSDNFHSLKDKLIELRRYYSNVETPQQGINNFRSICCKLLERDQ